MNMNKKDKIRNYLSKSRDGYTFSAKGLANLCEVTEKDVSNVTRELLKVGVLNRTKTDDGSYVYSYDQVVGSLHFAKFPFGQIAARTSPSLPHPNAKAAHYVDPAHIVPTGSSQKKRRTPFIISIDTEIAQLQAKIKRLNAVRKEFS